MFFYTVRIDIMHIENHHVYSHSIRISLLRGIQKMNDDSYKTGILPLQKKTCILYL